MSEIILEVKDLTKRFGGLTAVDNVSLHLNKGEIVGLIGANGAGKTTLFNMISGNFAPTSGKIIYKGQEIQGMPPQKICKMGFGRTYQIVQPFSALTLRENVMPLMAATIPPTGFAIIASLATPWAIKLGIRL